LNLKLRATEETASILLVFAQAEARVI